MLNEFEHCSFIILIFLLIVKNIQIFSCQELQKYSFKLDSEIVDIRWCGESAEDLKYKSTTKAADAKKIFVLTQRGKVYLSQDDGKTWNPLKNQFNDLITSKQPKQANFNLYFIYSHIQKQKKEEFIVALHYNELDKQLIYFQGMNGYSYISYDCGKAIDIFKHNKNITEFKFSNNQAGQLIGAAKKRCLGTSLICDNLYNLTISKDYGQTWKKLVDNVTQFEWYFFKIL